MGSGYGPVADKQEMVVLIRMAVDRGVSNKRTSHMRRRFSGAECNLRVVLFGNQQIALLANTLMQGDLRVPLSIPFRMA